MQTTTHGMNVQTTTTEIQGAPMPDLFGGPPQDDIDLTLPVRVGELTDTIPLELGHCEWLIRMAAMQALYLGLVRGGQLAWARILVGNVLHDHGEVLCLESLRLELVDGSDRVLHRVDFPREVFADFAAARGLALLARQGTRRPVTFALHAGGMSTGRLAVPVPVLTPMSGARLRARAVHHGVPPAVPSGTPATSPGRRSEAGGAPGDARIASDWIVTFVARKAWRGFADLAGRSRASGCETAGLVVTRLGFDPVERTFVRVLDEVLDAPGAQGTPSEVVTPGSSWGVMIDRAADLRAPASVHTHVHLDAAPADVPDAGLPVSHDPVISVDDIVTHLTAYPDPLSAAVIVSVYDDGNETALYGYGPDARLRREGFWLLGEAGD